jgi:hypothetical protein
MRKHGQEGVRATAPDFSVSGELAGARRAVVMPWAICSMTQFLISLEAGMVEGKSGVRHDEK